MRPVFSDLLTTFLELLYLPQKWSYGTKQGTNRTVQFSQRFWRIKKFNRTFWTVARAVWPPASKFFFVLPTPPVLRHWIFFFLQLLKLPVIYIPFIEKRQKEFLNFVKKQRRYELLNVKKPVIFKLFDSFKFLAFLANYWQFSNSKKIYLEMIWTSFLFSSFISILSKTEKKSWKGKKVSFSLLFRPPKWPKNAVRKSNLLPAGQSALVTVWNVQS